MILKAYHKKRNFKKTPEPKGSTSPAKKNKNLYIIQKHAASHLHYDFRLELNGVLLSWAVPKGPSLDPTVKRLAMHVEDHPVEYGSFEGIIPQGQYGGGTVMLWDKGQWICEDENPTAAYKKGNLTFQLKAKKLNGRWKLIRINNNDKTWLLMKLKDEFAKTTRAYDITVEQPNSVISKGSIDDIAKNYNATWSKKGVTKRTAPAKKKTTKLSKITVNLPKHPFPAVIYPELATLVDKPPTGKKWVHEIKFDGYRLLAYKQGKKVTILTRNQNDWTSKFKTLANEIAKLPVKNVILDGEIVILDKNQHSNFQLLQNAIKENSSEYVYYIFDLPYFDQYDLTTSTLLERKSILETLLSEHDSNMLRYSDHVSGSGQTIFKKSCQLGLEGIISKEVNSHYSQKRDKAWLKIKCTKRQEFVIGGFNKSTRRNYFRSLMLGTFNKHKELLYHGNVGTGFTEQSLKMIYALLTKHIINSNPFSTTPPGSKNATWVEPIIVAEIEFTEWTNDGTLRHPSFKGIRADKPAKNINKEIELSVKKVVDKAQQEKKSTAKKAHASYPLSHPDKLLYPEDKITKYAVAAYYDAIHEWILPYISNRPLTIVRCPNDYKKCFFQKHISNQLPAGLHEIMLKEKEGKDEYLYLKNKTGLISLTQLGVLELHPWNSRIGKVEHPDLIIFDLDPAPELPWKKVVNAAFRIKEILATFKLKSYVKTTGGKGLHVVIPIKPEYNWNEVKTFSKVLVDFLMQTYPKEYLAVMAKSKRANKIFIDYLRNQRGATSIAPYSTRARLHAPIATPISWDELTNDIRDTYFTIKTLPSRLAKLTDDPWADFFKIKQSLNLDKIK